jgi:hypothetical protein
MYDSFRLQSGTAKAWESTRFLVVRSYAIAINSINPS